MSIYAFFNVPAYGHINRRFPSLLNYAGVAIRLPITEITSKMPFKYEEYLRRPRVMM